jgi:hypothetical protein
MGFLDKVKAQAQVAAEKAQQGVAQGQQKLGDLQAKRQADALLRDLGAAYYAEQRAGGAADAVSAALARVDAHVAENGPIDTAATAPTPGTPPVPGTPRPMTTPTAPSAPANAPATPAPPPPGTEPPRGNFSLEDL